MRLTDQARAVMGYHDHYVVDGGKARIILAALVTPASVMDNTPLLDLVRWARFRFQLQPKIAVGDTKYGTAVNIGGLEQDGIRAYTPRTDYDARHPYYSYEMFEYDVEHDRYICPQGKFLTYHSNYAEDHVFFYKADPQDCNHCPVKEECTGGWEGRRIRRSHFQEYLDRAATYRDTEPYKKAMRKRKVWVEPLFGEAKDWHGLRRFRRRGIANVNIEAVMIASGQNLKRLLRAKGWRRCFPTPEAGAPALAVPIPTFFDLKKLLFRVQSAIVEQILSSEGQNPAPVRHKFFNTLCICRHFTHNHMRRIVLFPSP
jgi:hypothetical protein